MGMNRINLSALVYDLAYKLKENSPVRTSPLGKSGASPYPGNLRNNGINVAYANKDSARLIIGGNNAPYAPYTEYTSFSPGWIKLSVKEWTDKIESLGGKIT